MRRQLWHLGLVVLKMRKAAKAWHVRYELMKRFDAVERFVFSKGKRAVNPSGVGSSEPVYASQGEDEHGGTNDPNGQEDFLIIEDEARMPTEKEEMRLLFVADIIKQELAFCARVNKYHPRNYYQWSYRTLLIKNILIPLIKRVPTFHETLLSQEVMAMRKYLKENPTD